MKDFSNSCENIRLLKIVVNICSSGFGCWLAGALQACCLATERFVTKLGNIVSGTSEEVTVQVWSSSFIDLSRRSKVIVVGHPLIG